MTYRYRTGFFAFGLLGALILAETHLTSAEAFAPTAAPRAPSPSLDILPTGRPVALVGGGLDFSPHTALSPNIF